jgi:transcriptional antiterminator NusG
VVKVSHDPDSRDKDLSDPALEAPLPGPDLPGEFQQEELSAQPQGERPEEERLRDLAAGGDEEAEVGDDTDTDPDIAPEEELQSALKSEAAAEGTGAGTVVSAGEVEEEEEAEAEAEENVKRWYILKVQVNREESIRRALERRVKVAGLDRFFGEIVVPTEDVAEYNKSGKRRIVKRKLYPGYLMIHLALNDDTWFLVRETPGIGDFTGSAGKPTPMADHEVQRIVMTTRGKEAGDSPVKTTIPFKHGDRVRVKEGYFENFEGDVETIDEANGRVTVMINIFGRSVPVELEHWQMESV